MATITHTEQTYEGENNTATAVVQAQLDAFNRRDIEEFIACFAHDVRFEDGGGHVLIEGHEELRALFGPLFALSPALHAVVVHRAQIGVYVADEEHITGMAVAGEFPSAMHTLVMYQVVDERIVHVRMLM